MPLILSGCLMLHDPCEVDPDSDNLLGDASFETLTCWDDGDEDAIWAHGFLTDRMESPVSGAPVFAIENGEVTETYGRQLLQGRTRPLTRRAPLGLDSGQEYRLTFWAWTDTPGRTMLVQVTDGFEGELQTVALSDTWTEYTVEGIARGQDMSQAFLDMQFGGAVQAVIHIDDVWLEAL